MNRNSIVPLITQWEKFIEETKSNDLHEFASWLLDQQVSKKPLKTLKAKMYDEKEDYFAANYINKLNKYVKAYVKPLLHDTKLTNSDEFSILSLISQMDRPTKREVCMANAMELSTGIDMIRRLLKAGYIREQPHENDARAKRLTLTKNGDELLAIMYMRLSNIKQKVLADLNRNEKKELLRILEYLNHYHEKIYLSLA